MDFRGCEAVMLHVAGACAASVNRINIIFEEKQNLKTAAGGFHWVRLLGPVQLRRCDARPQRSHETSDDSLTTPEGKDTASLIFCTFLSWILQQFFFFFLRVFWIEMRRCWRCTTQQTQQLPLTPHRQCLTLCLHVVRSLQGNLSPSTNCTNTSVSINSCVTKLHSHLMTQHVSLESTLLFKARLT